MNEIEKNEESEDQYKKFIEHYIDLYYSPLVEEYEELKYYTSDSDKKMLAIINNNKIKNIQFK
jgi:hypothetical protein